MTTLAILLLITFTLPPAAKIISISVAVYALIQLLKQAPQLAPYLTGWRSLAVNTAFCVVGVVAITPPDQLYTFATVMQIAQALGGAAGIHGTISKLSGSTEAPVAKS